MTDDRDTAAGFPEEGLPELLRVGDIVYRPRTGEVTRDGVTHRLRPQAVEAFEMLVRRPGRLVERDELIARLWPHGHIEGDLGLNACVKQIRAALGDDAGEPRFIETLRARGYRLVAPVEPIDAEEPDRGRATAAQSSMTRRNMGRGWYVGGAAALLLLLVFGPSLVRPDPALEQAEPIRLAVLPLGSIGTDTDTAGAPLRAGLTEDLITALANAHPERLVVVGRASVQELVGQSLDGPQIASRLGLDYVLTGVLRPAVTGYRLTVQLLDAQENVYAWSDGHDLDDGGLGGIHRVLADGVLSALSLRTAPQTALAFTGSDEVRDAVLRARYLRSRFSRDDSERAIGILEEVIGSDSTETEALIEVARHRLIRGELLEADQALGRVQALDADAAGMDHVAGRIALYGRVHPEAAIVALERAVRIQPGTAEVRHDYAQALAAAGRLNEAVRQGRIAKDLDPVSSVVLSDMGWIFYYAGNFEEARSTCRETLELRPQSLSARKCVILAAVGQNALSEVADDVGALSVLLGGNDQARVRVEQAARDGESEIVWGWIYEQSLRNPLDPADLARTLMLLGRDEEAATVLGRLPDGSLGTLLARQDPLFRPS